jgi:hypothetical protein
MNFVCEIEGTITVLEKLFYTSKPHDKADTLSNSKTEITDLPLNKKVKGIHTSPLLSDRKQKGTLHDKN